MPSWVEDPGRAGCGVRVPVVQDEAEVAEMHAEAGRPFEADLAPAAGRVLGIVELAS